MFRHGFTVTPAPLLLPFFAVMADLPIDPVTGRFLLDDSLGAVFIGTILAGMYV
jgi:hypothetical protein